MRSQPLVTLVTIPCLLAACQGRLAHKVGGTATAVGMVTVAGETPAPASPPATTSPASPPAPSSPSVVAGSPVAATLSGHVLLPASLLTDNGSGIIANHGSGVISNNGSTAIATARHLLGLEGQGLAGAEVVLADALGQPVAGVAPVKTDASGIFAFDAVPPGLHTVLVHAPTTEGQTATLRALAIANPVEVDLATTLVTAGSLADLGATPDAVKADTYTQAVAGVEAALQAPPDRQDNVDAQGNLRVELVRPAGQVATLDGLANNVDDLVGTLADLGAQLTADLEPRLAPSAFTEVAALTSGDVPVDSPVAVAVQPGTGRVALLDAATNTISIVGPKGEVMPLAGSGSAGDVDGVGAAASFNAKNAGLAYGADGLLYLADWQNHKLRTIAADGTVATLANVRTAGPPCAVAVAPDGTIYFCTYNAKTSGLYVLEQGKPRAIATSPRATGSDLPPDTFGVPLALVLDAAGNAYLADYYRNVIDKVTPDGHVSRFAGSGDAGFADGPAAQARFRSPIDLAFGRDGMLYVADRFNNRIRGIAPDGTVSTIAGWGAGKRVGKLATARFRDLRALAVDAGGHLVVADRSAHGLRIVR